MARRRQLEAERERDIAIEEAATAYYELDLARAEVAALRREKEAWESGQDAWSQRHDQLLWHVGAMAEKLWRAFEQSVHNGGQMLSMEDTRLLALESFAQLEPKDDAQVYEEMHALYAKMAHMEAQQTKTHEKLRELKRLNDDLVEKILECEDKHQNAKPEVRDAGSDTEDLRQTTDAGEVAPVHPLPEHRLHSAPHSETSPVELLQAQLAMYINYFKRHRPRRPTEEPAEDRIDR